MKLQLYVLLVMSAVLFSACEKETDMFLEEDVLQLGEESELKSAKAKNSGFVHGIEIDIDGEMYYFAGAPDGENGAIDVPGHYWVQAGKNRVVGKHYNTGPFGASKWWSSDAEDGALLYVVNGIIDTWTDEKAEVYASKGYLHYHEFLSVDGGGLHPHKVVWLKHTAVTSFTLDGGPMPALSHDVTPGIDFEFIPNWMKPYTGAGH